MASVYAAFCGLSIFFPDRKWSRRTGLFCTIWRNSGGPAEAEGPFYPPALPGARQKPYKKYTVPAAWADKMHSLCRTISGGRRERAFRVGASFFGSAGPGCLLKRRGSMAGLRGPTARREPHRSILNEGAPAHCITAAPTQRKSSSRLREPLFLCPSPAESAGPKARYGPPPSAALLRPVSFVRRGSAWFPGTPFSRRGRRRSRRPRSSDRR